MPIPELVKFKKNMGGHCARCGDLMFVFSRDIMSGEQVFLSQIYPDKGQAPWKLGEALICRKCGARVWGMRDIKYKMTKEEKMTSHISEAPKKSPHYLIQFFEYDHLPANLRDVSSPFCYLAKEIDAVLPDNAEKTTALRKLLESKDCAVRSVLFKKED